MLAGDISPIAAMRNGDAFSTVEFSRDAHCAFEQVLWLGPRTALPFIEAGSFWSVWKIGVPWLVRFQHRTNVFNRAMFEAVEVRPFSHLSDLITSEALWFPVAPRVEIAATPV